MYPTLISTSLRQTASTPTPAISVNPIGSSGVGGKPKKVRKLFSAEEDQLLTRIMYEQPFTTWIAVAAQIPGRSARQCRDRWANYLSPENKNGPWSVEEDKLLAKKFQEIGPQWTVIAKFFDGRSENNVKNRWYTHLKNRVGNLTAGSQQKSGQQTTIQKIKNSSKDDNIFMNVKFKKNMIEKPITPSAPPMRNPMLNKNLFVEQCNHAQQIPNEPPIMNNMSNLNNINPKFEDQQQIFQNTALPGNANNIPTNPGKKNAHTLLPPISSLDMDIPKQLNAQSINAIPPQMQSMKLRCASAQPFANYNRFT